jgi:NADPH2:quinone reductase
MRAIQVSSFGGPEVLTPVDLPDPEPGPGQVVVGLAAADVIFLDTLLRGGWGRDFFPMPMPYVPGHGGAGTVLRTGEGVDPQWTGRRVVARIPAGGYAEQAVADLDRIVPVPDDVPLPVAAALLHDGVTALSLDRLAAPEKDEWVLVTAAAGGAGTLLVQLAVDAGARVVAAASSAAKRALAGSLGAEVTVDYTRSGWVDEVREATGGGAAVVYDGAGGPLGTAAAGAVADGGRLVTYGTSDGFAAPDPDMLARRGIRLIEPLKAGPPPTAVMRDLLTEALDLAAGAHLRPVIAATYDLDRAADAHRALADRAVAGKALLIP